VAWPQPAKGKAVPVPRTILIVDDNTLVRGLIRAWVEGHEDWNVCGEAENGKTAVEKVEQLHPDIVLLDLQMPVMNGLEAARQISRVAPKTAMVMLTMHLSKQLLADAQAAGIRDVVSKTESLGEHLLSTLKLVCA
jgi:DNA-binding NarL/FixJ family response regulator